MRILAAIVLSANEPIGKQGTKNHIHWSAVVEYDKMRVRDRRPPVHRFFPWVSSLIDRHHVPVRSECEPAAGQREYPVTLGQLCEQLFR